MIDPANVPEVMAEELLARFIYQSSHIRASDGTAKPNAFMPPANLRFSVTRHLHATEAEIWSVGIAVGQQRNATLYGRADVLASKCSGHQLVVRPDPILGNPNHANVIGWPTNKPAQKIIAQELAAAASLVLYTDQGKAAAEL